MLRGELWWVDFGPTIGSEIHKRRPAVIVSNDAANRHASRVQVIPITSNVAKLYPCDASLAVEGRAARAMADQLMTVSKNRLRGRIGAVSKSEMRAVESALRVQLALFFDAPAENGRPGPRATGGLKPVARSVPVRPKEILP
ncbi:mRNA interferase MazF9 [Caulifigura coniformis]|uniref:mRNA interferase MazF9 n=1 Tax=Caulifigura coniformis TaxID=2527983 RepID=A0A517SA99_9PLAN|nr:type II toxin-antitoxin system PemK/MazF family toxin [Caulifigura coniformis]QDT53006.1 mRNA interferase MazF9 [Caulifigura coniformis]